MDRPIRDAEPPPNNLSHGTMERLNRLEETQDGISNTAGTTIRKSSAFFACLAAVVLIRLLATPSSFPFENLPWRACVTLAVLCIALFCLVANVLSTVLTFLMCGFVLVVTDVLSPSEALLGFSNHSVVTVAMLSVVAEAIKNSHLLRPVSRLLLGNPKKLWAAHLRLLIFCSVVSFFIDTTPTITIVLPILLPWSKRLNFSISKLNMPLNYAIALGGSMTLLGSSKNLVIKGLVEDAGVRDLDGELVVLSLFGPANLVAVIWVAGMAYIFILAQFLTKVDESDSAGQRTGVLNNSRQYTLALEVLSTSPIVGKTVIEAGLSTVEGLVLIKIERETGEVLLAAPLDSIVNAGDRLLFSGSVSNFKELCADVLGVVPATFGTNKLPVLARNRASYFLQRRLVELIIAPYSALVSRTPRQLNFISRFDAAIIAVHREGDYVYQGIPDIVIEGGDTLLVESGPDFAKAYAHDLNFAFVGEVHGFQSPPRNDLGHSTIASVLVVAMITLVAADILMIFEAASACAVLMIVTRFVSLQNAADSVPVSDIVAFAASFALSNAMDKSGTSSALASSFAIFKDFGNIGILFGIYLAAGILTSVLSQKASGALLWAIVRRVLSQQKTLSPYAAICVFIVGINSSYTTPIAYRTNNLLHHSGGYTSKALITYGGNFILFMAPVTVLTANFISPSR